VVLLNKTDSTKKVISKSEEIHILLSLHPSSRLMNRECSATSMATLMIYRVLSSESPLQFLFYHILYLVLSQ
jgi:hypothetical protein